MPFPNSFPPKLDVILQGGAEAPPAYGLHVPFKFLFSFNYLTKIFTWGITRWRQDQVSRLVFDKRFFQWYDRRERRYLEVKVEGRILNLFQNVVKSFTSEHSGVTFIWSNWFFHFSVDLVKYPVKYAIVGYLWLSWAISDYPKLSSWVITQVRGCKYKQERVIAIWNFFSGTSYRGARATKNGI